jgi:hypothetical protein
MTNEIKLEAETYLLRWDKGAMFRADDCGLWSGKQGLGFAAAAKYLWSMLPSTGRSRYPTPEDVARVMPPLNEAWPVINSAVAAGGEGTDPKNVFGSTSGPSQSSS